MNHRKLDFEMEVSSKRYESTFEIVKNSVLY